jgi:hypothetical protein
MHASLAREREVWHARLSRQHTLRILCAYAAHTLRKPVMHASRVRRSQTTASFLVSSITTIPSTCIRQHTSAYVSIRQHTSAYVSIRPHTSAYVRMDLAGGEQGAVFVMRNRFRV